MLHSMNHCGSAAAQCGKAAPFRRSLFSFEAAPQREAQPPVIFRALTVRQSLTALCGGKAAVVDWVIHPQVKAQA
jgi:hypothetical protein